MRILTDVIFAMDKLKHNTPALIRLGDTQKKHVQVIHPQCERRNVKIYSACLDVTFFHYNETYFLILYASMFS